MAARSCASFMGPSRCNPSCTNPASAGSPLTAATKSARSVSTIGARRAASRQRVGERDALGVARCDGEQLLELVDDDRGVGRHLPEAGDRIGTRCHDDDVLAAPAHGRQDAGERQGRLAAPRRAHDGQHARVQQPGRARRDVVLPSEELVGIGGLDSGRGPCRGRPPMPVGRRRRSVPVWGRGRERPVPQRPGRARIDAQLLPQDAPGLVDGTQCVGLPVGAVVGLGEHDPALLPKRLAVGQAGGQGRGFVDPALAQERRRQQLLGAPAGLRQAGGLVAARAPAVQFGQRLALEEPESFAQERYGTPVLPHGDELGGVVVEALEEPGVDLLVTDGEAVPVGHGLDGPAAQHLPQSQDRALDDLAPRGWGIVAVECFGEAVGRHGGGAGGHQRRQHDPVPTSQGLIVPVDPTRAQHPDAHPATMGASRSSVNGGVTDRDTAATGPP